jgi:hypothetical protein
MIILYRHYDNLNNGRRRAGAGRIESGKVGYPLAR